MTEWRINIREEGMSPLAAIALRVPSAPPGYLRQLHKKHRISMNGETPPEDRTVRPGELITVQDSERWQEILQLCPLQPAQILYEDDHCLIINKPAGLATHHTSDGHDNLLQHVQDFFRLRREPFKAAPVHRLDIGTSGAVLFGKGKAATRQLGQMIMAGGMAKHYLGLVHGGLPASGQLTSPVAAKGRIKAALTRYQAIASVDSYTLLELEIITGRRHQIRQQLAAMGWPLVGDRRYGNSTQNCCRWPLLHSYRMAFQSPFSGRDIDLKCPLGEGFRKQLRQLGFDQDDGSGFIRQKSAT